MGTPDEADLKAQLWRRAYEIFDDGLETPTKERYEFARARASDDPELLEIVLELLQNATEEEPDDIEEEDSRIGSRVGPYEITAKLPRGGMRPAYAAHYA